VCVWGGELRKGNFDENIAKKYPPPSNTRDLKKAERAILAHGTYNCTIGTEEDPPSPWTTPEAIGTAEPWLS
jgi:hypothetical protein